MDTIAVVLEQPERLVLRQVALTDAQDDDCVVDIDWSGVSTGTERLLWSGRMPPFPGMGYPLIPGYESVGRVAVAGTRSGRRVGETVFVPGARCFGDIRGLFGGAAARLVVRGDRAHPIPGDLGENGVLIALAATAHHAVAGPAPDGQILVVGHGVLGRLVARLLVVAGGPAPVVWEKNPLRAAGGAGYAVLDPASDEKRDYRRIVDVSGDADILDSLIGRLAPGGEIVLAGFYDRRLSFAFPPAFMREARLRVAAEWKPDDLAAVKAMIADGRLSLEGLITHRKDASLAASAYETAFGDPSCLKMLLDWRRCS